MSAIPTSFEQELESHRHALTGYCYRMLGSGSEAEDAVQEAMTRAWGKSADLKDAGALKAWLYRIASNVCFDMLGGAQRRAVPMELGPASEADAPVGTALPEHMWVTPVADSRVLPPEADSAEIAEHRETLKLAFVAALQHLPARQRAALVLCEVLKWKAAEAAELLDTSVASINSALQRARATLEALDLDRESAPGEVSGDDDRELLGKYVAAFESYDISELVTLLKSDATFSMPPLPLWITGPESVHDFMLGTGAKCRGSRLLVTEANGGPAVAIYNPTEDGHFDAWAIVLLECSDGAISGLHHFIFPALFAEFGLPTRLDAEDVGQADELQQPA